MATVSLGGQVHIKPSAVQIATNENYVSNLNLQLMQTHMRLTLREALVNTCQYDQAISYGIKMVICGIVFLQTFLIHRDIP